MCSRGKLMVQLVRKTENKYGSNINKSDLPMEIRNCVSDQMHCISDQEQSLGETEGSNKERDNNIDIVTDQLLRDIPTDVPFDLPFEIHSKIQDQILMVVPIGTENETPIESEIGEEIIENEHNIPIDDETGTSSNNKYYEILDVNGNENTYVETENEREKVNEDGIREDHIGVLLEIHGNENVNAENGGDNLKEVTKNLSEFGENNSEIEEEPDVMNDDSETELNENKKRPNNFREISKLKRLRGKQYTGYTRSSTGKVKQNKIRKKRVVKSRCHHKEANKVTNRTFMCYSVTEQNRERLFKFFWDLPNWDARMAYIKGLVTSRKPQRRRKTTSEVLAKKKESHDCYIPLENGERVLVCKTMLLNTLDLGRDTFLRWCKNVMMDNSNLSEKENGEVTDRLHTDKFRNNMKNKDGAREWLEQLPKVPSHYCRSSSKKVYVESVFRSTLHMYHVYKRYCEDQNLGYISRTLFRKILGEGNIAIHKPRKDQCDTCCGWKSGNVSEQLYSEHVEKKKEAAKAKIEAKESASQEKLVVTMDLQSVLLAPKLEASSIYYKQKLQIHNFTVYSLNDGNVDLYVWHESNGGVTSNEFTSCIVDYIRATTQDKHYKHVVLISDGCGYQNRNKVLSSALLNLAQQLQITIQQLILERGHTMMEADSVHSSLEAHFKPPIFAPSDYIVRMRQARLQHPYNVHNIDFTFFLDYEDVEGNMTSIRPNRINKVTDLRGILYLPSGKMQYKIRHTDEWTDFTEGRTCHKGRKENLHPKPLYTRPLKIKKQKYLHLQELKAVMERDYHPFYDGLPH